MSELTLVRVVADSFGCEAVELVATGERVMCGLSPHVGARWARANHYTIMQRYTSRPAPDQSPTQHDYRRGTYRVEIVDTQADEVLYECMAYEAPEVLRVLRDDDGLGEALAALKESSPRARVHKHKE